MSETFDAEVREWGRSLGLVVPKETRERMQLLAGDSVSVTLESKAEGYGISADAYKLLKKEALKLSTLPDFKRFTLPQLVEFVILKSVSPNQEELRHAKVAGVNYIDVFNTYSQQWRKPETNPGFTLREGKALKKRMLPLMKRLAGFIPSLDLNDANNKEVLRLFRAWKGESVAKNSDDHLLKLLNYGVMLCFSTMQAESIRKAVMEKYAVKDMVAFVEDYRELVWGDYPGFCEIVLKAHQKN